VSLEQSSVCVVDGDGRIVREGKVGQAKSVRLKEKIAAHEVTSVGNDRAELSKMAGQAREADGHDGLTVIADRGYVKGEEILACEIWHDAALPKPAPSGRVSGKGLTSSFRGRGREGPESALLGHSASHSERLFLPLSRPCHQWPKSAELGGSSDRLTLTLATFGSAHLLARERPTMSRW
jgi:hypothetical protein